MESVLVVHPKGRIILEEDTLLKERFGRYSFYRVPDTKWSDDELMARFRNLISLAIAKDDMNDHLTVVFINPAPIALLAMLSRYAGQNDSVMTVLALDKDGDGELYFY